MAPEVSMGNAPPKAGVVAGREFARRFSNLLVELGLQTGIRRRTEEIVAEFADEHPNIRAFYISRDVDETYFSDGSCGWEAGSRPKLQGIAIENDKMYEFLAFSQGLRTHCTPLETIMNVEELWLETTPSQPFVLRICMYHSFPATTILYAPDGESQDAAVSFLRRLKYLRGF